MTLRNFYSHKTAERFPSSSHHLIGNPILFTRRGFLTADHRTRSIVPRPNIGWIKCSSRHSFNLQPITPHPAECSYFQLATNKFTIKVSLPNYSLTLGVNAAMRIESPGIGGRDDIYVVAQGFFAWGQIMKPLLKFEWNHLIARKYLLYELSRLWV